MEKDFKLQINSIDDFQNNELSPQANRNLGPVYVLWATQLGAECIGGCFGKDLYPGCLGGAGQHGDWVFE